MRTYKRTRAKRPLRRRRYRRAGKSTLATKAFVKKATMKALESKRSSTLGSLTETDIDGFNSHYVGQNIGVGVTDRGRIGNTVHLTGISVRWKISCQFIDEGAVLPTVHIVIVQPKNGFQLPASRFYKAFDNGADNPYEVLDKTSMNDGRRWLNTDDLKVLKHYKKLILKNDNIDNTITEGHCYKPHKTTLVINQNGTSQPTVGDISPPIWIYMYVTLGDEAKYENNNAFQLDWCVSIYYKD